MQGIGNSGHSNMSGFNRQISISTYCFYFHVMILEATNIHKKYDTLEVLKGVSLQVNKGEIVSLVGPSGAGKSTLLHIIGTLDKPDAGSVTIEGKEILKQNEKSLSAFRNKSLGFIFQF